MTSDLAIVANRKGEDHFRAINRLLDSTQSFDCAVAFAKMSGFKRIKSKLVVRLRGGMKARFFVGLGFCQSEPDILQELLKLKREFRVEVFVSNPNNTRTFHPKIYRFDRGNQVSLIVGSANLTHGGFTENYEVSVSLRTAEERRVSNFLRRLIEDGDVVVLSSVILSRYRKKYEANKLAQLLAQKRVTRLSKESNKGLAYLQEFLNEMKASGDFTREMKSRTRNRKEANRVLEKIGNSTTLSASLFDRYYSRLAGDLWVSGGLLRQKSRIAKRREEFRSLCALAVFLRKGTSVDDAYEELQAQALTIVGVGPNILTEILVTRDNTRFAVMNQNSVSGLRIAGYEEFPERPNKQLVDGRIYKKFCQAADSVRAQLELQDFSELDALLNYVYWQEEDLA